MDYRIKVIHTEDKKLTREGTSNMLKDEGIDVIAEAANGRELLNLLKTITPDLVLLDLEMPIMDGNMTLKEIKAKYPRLKVVVLTSYTDECLIEDFKTKGANAFLTKDSDIRTIANTIKRVYYSDEYNNFPKSFNSLFTPSEIKIIPHLLAGKTSKQIAKQLGISSRTVEAVRDRAYEKAKCKNASEFAGHCAIAGLQYLGYKSDLNQNN
jgi:DNA-binding NarL/FixJ family response regulator